MKKAKKQVAKKAAKTRKHEAIPFERIATLYSDGKSMEQIAKAVSRWNADSPDGSKSLRAIVSNMITKGYRNKEEKLIRLKKRARSKAEPQPAKKATKKPATKKPVAKKSEPKKQDVKAREQKPEPKLPSEPKPEVAPSAVPAVG